MSHAYDQEFQFPPEKGPATEPPTSGLAIVSLVFSILGVTALPLVGSIVGVATSHAAFGQIRESRGRVGGKSMAKAGLVLGYLPFGLALVGGALALLIVSSTRAVTQAEVPASPSVFATTVAIEDESGRGVKMINEMGREDHDLVEGAGVPSIGPQIVAFYNAGKPRHDPEFAVLTDRALLYVKDGRTTLFNLADVVEVTGDDEHEAAGPEDAAPDSFRIVAREKGGPRMRIRIAPACQGPAFLEALESAWKDATSHADAETN